MRIIRVGSVVRVITVFRAIRFIILLTFNRLIQDRSVISVITCHLTRFEVVFWSHDRITFNQLE